MRTKNGWYKASYETPQASKKSNFVHAIHINRHVRKVGDYVSLSTMSTHPYHSGLELDWLRIVDATFSARTMLAQPERFEFVYDGKRYLYTADLLVEFFDGSRIYYEVKNERAADSRKFKDRWQLCTEELGKRGHSLELVRASEIRREPRYSNIRDLQIHRSVPADPKIVLPLDNLLGDGRKVTLGQLYNFFQDRIYARQVIGGMILRRHFTTDFDIPLSDASPVWKV